MDATEPDHLLHELLKLQAPLYCAMAQTTMALSDDRTIPLVKAVENLHFAYKETLASSEFQDPFSQLRTLETLQVSLG